GSSSWRWSGGALSPPSVRGGLAHPLANATKPSLNIHAIFLFYHAHPAHHARLASAPRPEAVWLTCMVSLAALGFVCCRSGMSPPCPQGLRHVPARDPRPAADGGEGHC